MNALNLLMVRYVPAIIASIPLLTGSIENFAEAIHPIALATLIAFSFVELAATLTRYLRGRFAGQLLTLAECHLSGCVCVSGIGAALWIAGAIISIAWLIHIGYLIYAGGHLTKSLIDLWQRIF